MIKNGGRSRKMEKGGTKNTRKIKSTRKDATEDKEIRKKEWK